jgi:rhamnosyl/mannosyltransferase
MRVVHVYKSYPPVRGGIEGHLDLITRLLVESGIDAEVLCARSGGAPRREVRLGVRVQRCAAPLTLASTPLPPSLPWALHQNAADVVHLHSPWPPNELGYLIGGRSRPLVVTIHCEAVRQARLAALLAPMTQRVLRRAARILVTGRFMLDRPFLAEHI